MEVLISFCLEKMEREERGKQNHRWLLKTSRRGETQVWQEDVIIDELLKINSTERRRERRINRERERENERERKEKERERETKRERRKKGEGGREGERQGERERD